MSAAIEAAHGPRLATLRGDLAAQASRRARALVSCLLRRQPDAEARKAIHRVARKAL